MITKDQARIALLTAMLSAQAGAEIEDNADYRATYEGWANAQLVLLPTAFLPGPFGTAADLATIGMDVIIKNSPPSLVTADPNAVTPNSVDGCDYSFFLPQKEASFENILNLFDVKLIPDNWGALSAGAIPEVDHANAEVELRVDNFYLDDWSQLDRTMDFPSGNHRVNWTAATQVDPLLDYIIPGVLFIISAELKYSKALLATEPKSAARAARIGGEFLINAGIEIGLIGVGQIENDRSIDTALHEQSRTFTVYDINPPTIAYQPPAGTANPFVLEANRFGGERWDDHKALFRQWIVASDPCDKNVGVGNDAPFLLPLGLNEIEWEALDSGPLGAGNSGRATVTQQILVQDTRAPIILAPPSRVIESSSPATTDDVDIGTAVVFDVADPDPAISSTAMGATFPVNSRTEVRWTAIDASANSSEKSQWITVKAPGTNRAPSVNNVSGNTLTSQSIDLVLQGSDPDFLSGRFDPLMFDIVSPPGDGFFVAPLVPYFIEDFRVKPNSTIGDILNNFGNPQAEIYAQYCAAGTAGTIPTDFVFSPEFVHVTDQGISYVLDRRWQCDTGSTAAITRARISKWSEQGELLAETSDDLEQITRLTLDKDGMVYTANPQISNLEMFLVQRDADLNRITSWKLEAPSGRMHASRLDSATGLIYATNKSRVYVYDSTDVTNSKPALLGTLSNGESFLSGQSGIAGSSNRGYNMEVDSLGNFYIVDSGFDRVHKFAPSTLDGSTFIPGRPIGWMGRCNSGPGCDDEHGRSFGYSCSAATPCEVLTANGSNCGTQTGGLCTAGSRPGQFNDPIGMALDPEDTLYITDYNNARVQRFTPLGDFAGEAASTCDGTCFVLGDMGRPLDISVNSTQFYVLDRDRDLMHIFETAPFKDITENSVVVEYASDNDFQGTDTFTFRADDGLIDSNLGTATINVARNFRAPEALDDALVTDEDTALPVNLLASDPDGIAGIDFNGLDTLSYTVVRGPANGVLSGSGEARTYTPNQDFNGTDEVVFKVNDSRDDSNEATVTITVNPVNDQPIVRFTDAEAKFMRKAIWPLVEGKIVGTGMEAGLGYPAPLMGEYDDPDADQNYFVQIDWGDGGFDVSASNAPPPEPGDETNGPIITPTINGTGQILAKHVYLTPGVQTVNLSVIDTGPGNPLGDVEADITVIPMVDVVLEPVVNSEAVEPGQATSLVIKISNEPPQDPIVGMDATNVEFTGELPEGVELLTAATTKGSCRQLDITTTCQLGMLAPSEEQFITLLLLPDINFDPESFGYTINATSLEPDASKENLAVVEVQVLPQTLFSDSFE